MTPAAEGATSGGTRERLIVAAGQHLATRGPRAVELRAICIELGISPSLVNYHFSSPEQLLWLAAIRAYAQHVHEQEDLVSQAKSGADAVEAWVNGTVSWMRDNPGIASVIDFPQQTLAGVDDIDDFVKELTHLSRMNVASLGSAILATVKRRQVRMVSAQRVALLIKTNSEFAYWISVVGFASQGAGMWIAGRKPYSPLWRAFGFSPDKQIRTTVQELIARMAKTPAQAIPDPDTLTDEEPTP
jgi:AcrR family transcriptional regulator